MPPRKTADPGEEKSKAPACMLIPLSERSEKLVRDTAKATGKTQSVVRLEVATRTLDGKLLLDGLVEAVCRDIVKDHARAMNALFEPSPPKADNGGAMDPSGKEEP